TVTVEPTVAHPVVLPANSYCALIQGQSLDQTTLFKTVADHTEEPGGSPVELVSHLGGVRMNLKAGTELRWLPPLAGVPETVQLPSAATGATDAPLRQVVFFEELASERERDFWTAGMKLYPAAMVVREASEPPDGRTV